MPSEAEIEAATDILGHMLQSLKLPREGVQAMATHALTAAERVAWQDIATAPKDGRKVLVSDGRCEWISSRVVGSHALPQRGGMPTNGHDWYIPESGRYPTIWHPLPTPPEPTT